jgi:hypothetical protein
MASTPRNELQELERNLKIILMDSISIKQTIGTLVYNTIIQTLYSRFYSFDVDKFNKAGVAF